jgi:hypothetical protein
MVVSHVWLVPAIQLQFPCFCRFAPTLRSSMTPVSLTVVARSLFPHRTTETVQTQAECLYAGTLRMLRFVRTTLRPRVAREGCQESRQDRS